MPAQVEHINILDVGSGQIDQPETPAIHALGCAALLSCPRTLERLAARLFAFLLRHDEPVAGMVAGSPVRTLSLVLLAAK
jgi:hypothetical protein